MKTSKRLKVLTIIVAIILISIVSFLGVYDFKGINQNNLVKNFAGGMDLTGKQVIRIKVDDSVKKNDDDKTTTENDTEETATENKETENKEEYVNAKELLTKENYQKSYKIIQDRMEYMDAEEYRTRFNEEDGAIEIELLDSSLTDYIIQSFVYKGTFKLSDSETKEVLLDNSFIKNAKVLYGNGNQNSNGTTVYLDIEFNKDGAKKLEEISKKYVKTTEQVVNENGETEDKEVTKQVTITLDDDSIVTTSFGDTLSNGHIYITVGQSTTSTADLNRYALQASVYAAILRAGEMPLKYTVEETQYIVSNLNRDIITYVALTTLAVGIIALIITLKAKGIIASVLQIGYIALLLLVLKYTNVAISLEGLFAIVLVALINIVFMIKVISSINKNENPAKAVNDNILKFVNMSIPFLIVAIVFCFVKWLEIKSFGMVMFWGYAIALLYNITFTKIMLKNTLDK